MAYTTGLEDTPPVSKKPVAKQTGVENASPPNFATEYGATSGRQVGNRPTKTRSTNRNKSRASARLSARTAPPSTGESATPPMKAAAPPPPPPQAPFADRATPTSLAAIRANFQYDSGRGRGPRVVKPDRKKRRQGG